MRLFFGTGLSAGKVFKLLTCSHTFKNKTISGAAGGANVEQDKAYRAYRHEAFMIFSDASIPIF